MNAFDLPRVIEVVAGEHARYLLDRFLPALGMDAVVLPLLGLERFQQRKVPIAHHAKLLERLSRVTRLVVSARDPRILIVSSDGRRERRESTACETRRRFRPDSALP